MQIIVNSLAKNSSSTAAEIAVMRVKKMQFLTAESVVVRIFMLKSRDIPYEDSLYGVFVKSDNKNSVCIEVFRFVSSYRIERFRIYAILHFKECLGAWLVFE